VALDTDISQTSYEGNGSTSTGYPIPFSVLSVDHVLVGKLDEDDDIILLDAEDYTVDLEAMEVRTNPAIASTETVVVMRSVPYTQPTSYPEGGAFPAKEHERALDRIVMMVQQLARAFNGTGIITGGNLSDVQVFANAAARAAATPRRVGQLGIQTDTSSFWFGSSVSAGAWSQIAKRIWTWSREVWGHSEALAVGTRYAGHIHRGGVIKAIRLSHNGYEEERKATVNVKINGLDAILADVLLSAESTSITSGFSMTVLYPGDRIDVEVVSVGAPVGYTPAPSGLQLEIEIHES
jgi:hypothetical protein